MDALSETKKTTVIKVIRKSRTFFHTNIPSGLFGSDQTALFFYAHNVGDGKILLIPRNGLMKPLEEFK